MKKKQKNNLYLIGGVSAISLVFFIFYFGGLSGVPYVNGNIAQLSFVESSRDISCEAFNELAVTKNGVKSTVSSGRDGFNPLVDTSTLSLTDSGATVDAVHFRLVLLCDGDFLDDGDLGAGKKGGTVSGQFQMLLCGDPANGGTKCFGQASDRFFTQLTGVASSTTSFTQVPIVSKEIRSDVPLIVYEGNLGRSLIENTFPEGSGQIVFTSKMYPQFTFQFSLPNGIARATQDSFASNDQVYTQYGGVSNNAPVIPDTDGDGLKDNVDQCVGQAEDVNGFEDNDGCPDADKLIDTDGDGVRDEIDDCPDEQGLANNDGCPVTTTPTENDTDNDGILDNIDQCPTQPETINNFQDADGCPDTITTGSEQLDTDNDGVNNSDDICPNTPSNVSVDADGCEIPSTQDIVAVPPTLNDTDGDTVPDLVDDCPTLRGSVANDGCPVTTTDTPDSIVVPITPPSTTNTPQTTVDRSDQSDSTIIRGLSDFTVFIILAVISIIIVSAVLVKSGKVSL